MKKVSHTYLERRQSARIQSASKSYPKNTLTLKNTSNVPGDNWILEISGLLLGCTSFLGVRLHSRIDESSNPPQTRLASFEMAAELKLNEEKNKKLPFMFYC